MTEPLIRMQNVKKVFVTDEVETHALEDIDLESSAASTFRFRARPAAGSRLCSPFLGFSIHRRPGRIC